MALSLSGCATVYNPATERKELVFIDTKSEVALGKLINSNISRDYKISQDPQPNKRVAEIGKKIVEVCDRKDLEYRFFVVDGKELNAFSVPGGYVYVNTGLLAKANDDELAGVMAHEIGHVVARHAVKHLQAALGFDIVMGIAFNKSSAVELYRGINIVYNLISLGYSREDERQADKLGLIYAFKSKYNPRGMLTFFSKLKEEEKQGGTVNIPVFLRSHPALQERIKNIQAEIDKIEHPKTTTTIPSVPVAVSAELPSRHIKTNLSLQSADTKPVSPTPNRITRKMCPRCKRVYSSQYNFCPFDGQKLIF